MVRTNACCPCHLVRVISTLAVGKVAKIARRWLRCFHVAWLRIVVFFQKRVISLLFCLVVLPTSCLLDMIPVLLA